MRGVLRLADTSAAQPADSSDAAAQAAAEEACFRIVVELREVACPETGQAQIQRESQASG